MSGVRITALTVHGRALENKGDGALINEPYAESFIMHSRTTVLGGDDVGRLWS
jgi:O-methyltransferase involved in polyketide biosynthesis